MTNIIEQDLESLRALGPNWDGYHAPVIDPLTIESAKSLADKFPDDLDRPEVVPTPVGSLQFEWHDGKRSLELEFDSPQLIHYLYWDPPDEIEEDIILVEETESIIALIRRFFGIGDPSP